MDTLMLQVVTVRAQSVKFLANFQV